MNSKAVIVEIRAGAGGEEAALFVSDLFQAYSRYAQKKGWLIEVYDQNATSLGGYRRISFRITGDNAWALMKNEAGIHRVQRIPITEKIGRIQTSTIAVSVCPQLKSDKIKISPKDIKTEFFRSSGPGGQNVNKRETAVRLIHMPSGLTVACQNNRSQQKNKEMALDILIAKLVQVEQEKANKKQQMAKKRQMGSGERAEKIRSYHFPRNQITDHRLKKSWHNLEEVMKGDMDKIMKALAKREFKD